MVAHNQERAVFHLLLVHRIKRLLGYTLGLITNEALAGQSSLFIALHARRLDFSKFRKHFLQFLIVNAYGEVLDVEVVTVAFLFVLVVGNLDLLAIKLSLISFCNAGLSVLFAHKLDKAKTAGLAVGLFKLEGLNRAVLGKMVPKLLLRGLSRQVADDDIGLVIEAVLDDTHVDGAALDLRVIHFLLAFLGLLNSREVEEPKPFLTLSRVVFLYFDLGIQNFVATAFEVLQEVKIVKVLGKISDVHGRQFMLLLDRRRTSVALLILSRWLLDVGELQHVRKKVHESLEIVVALRLLHHGHLLLLGHLHTLRLVRKVLSLGRILLHVG